MDDRPTKRGAGILGMGAAACVACCVPPVIGFVAAAGIGTLVSVAVFGLAGLAVAGVVLVAYLRRRTVHRHPPPAGVPVTLGRKPHA